jgi:hypothetical protein
MQDRALSQALLTRAAIVEAQRQSAEQRGNRLARDAALDPVRRPPR